MSTKDLDPVAVLAWMTECFAVDADAGTMVWTNPPRNHPRMMGQEAGSSRPTHSNKKYVHVKWNRIALKRSWLIFLWVNRRWPDTDCLDHIDGNSANDSIANLREATVTQNAWNHHKRARRIRLPMGVRKIGSGRYQARISVHGRQIHLGAFDTATAAHDAYQAKRREFYGEFA